MQEGAQPRRRPSPSPRRGGGATPRSTPRQSTPTRARPTSGNARDVPAPQSENIEQPDANAEVKSSTRKKPSARKRAAAQPSPEAFSANGHSTPAADPAGPPAADDDRIHVFLKVTGTPGASGAVALSSCISWDEHSSTAWPTDLDGQRNGPASAFDAVYGVDTPESTLYPEVVDLLVDSLVRSPRGVAALLCCGQPEAAVNKK